MDGATRTREVEMTLATRGFQKVLEEHELEYTDTGGHKPTLEFDYWINGFIPWGFTINTKGDDYIFRVQADGPHEFDPPERPAVAEYLAWVNNVIHLGKLQIIMSTGRVRYEFRSTLREHPVGFGEAAYTLGEAFRAIENWGIPLIRMQQAPEAREPRAVFLDALGDYESPPDLFAPLPYEVVESFIRSLELTGGSEGEGAGDRLK